MKDSMPVPQLEIVYSKFSTKIALQCGLLGAFVSAVTYVMVRGVAEKTVEAANLMLEDLYETKDV